MEFLYKLQGLLPVASLALAIGALVSKFKLGDKGAKSHLLSSLLVFVVAGTGATAVQFWREWAQVGDLADEVVDIIGNQKKTYDDILAGIRRPDRVSLYLALDRLEEQKRIGAQIFPVASKDDDNPLSVRLYYVRTFNQRQ